LPRRSHAHPPLPLPLPLRLRLSLLSVIGAVTGFCPLVESDASSGKRPARTASGRVGARLGLCRALPPDGERQKLGVGAGVGAPTLTGMCGSSSVHDSVPVQGNPIPQGLLMIKLPDAADRLGLTRQRRTQLYLRSQRVLWKCAWREVPRFSASRALDVSEEALASLGHVLPAHAQHCDRGVANDGLLTQKNEAHFVRHLRLFELSLQFNVRLPDRAKPIETKTVALRSACFV